MVVILVYYGIEILGSRKMSMDLNWLAARGGSVKHKRVLLKQSYREYLEM